MLKASCFRNLARSSTQPNIRELCKHFIMLDVRQWLVTVILFIIKPLRLIHIDSSPVWELLSSPELLTQPRYPVPCLTIAQRLDFISSCSSSPDEKWRFFICWRSSPEILKWCLKNVLLKPHLDYLIPKNLWFLKIFLLKIVRGCWTS